MPLQPKMLANTTGGLTESCESALKSLALHP